MSAWKFKQGASNSLHFEMLKPWTVGWESYSIQQLAEGIVPSVTMQDEVISWAALNL